MGYGDQVSKFIYAYGFIVVYETLNPEFVDTKDEYDADDKFIGTSLKIHNILEQEFPQLKFGMIGHRVGREGSPGTVNNFFIYIRNKTHLEGEDLGSHVDVDIETLRNIDGYQRNTIDEIAKVFGTTCAWKSYVGNE